MEFLLTLIDEVHITRSTIFIWSVIFFIESDGQSFNLEALSRFEYTILEFDIHNPIIQNAAVNKSSNEWRLS